MAGRLDAAEPVAEPACDLRLHAFGNDVPHLEVSIVSDDERVRIRRFCGFQLCELVGHPVEDRMVLKLDLDVHLRISDEHVGVDVAQAGHLPEHLAEEFLGDSIVSNILAMGYAWQRGLVPVALRRTNALATENAAVIPPIVSAIG